MTNNDQPINYAYLSGFLQETLRGVPGLLEREGILEWNSPTLKVVEGLMQEELKRAQEAEREFSRRN